MAKFVLFTVLFFQVIALDANQMAQDSEGEEAVLLACDSCGGK